MSEQTEIRRLSEEKIEILEVLEALGEGFALSFRGLARRTGLTSELVGPATRLLAARGLAVFARGLWSDDGEPRGSGYGLTAAGRELARGVERCGICSRAFREDDYVTDDVTEGSVHRACCGDEPESYVDLETGEPMPTGTPLPAGRRWAPLKPSIEGGPQ